MSDLKSPLKIEKKRILVINPNPGFGGGASESLIDFLNTVNRERFDIFLMIPDSKILKEGIKRKTVQEKFFCHPLTENNNILQYGFKIVSFLFFLLKNGIELVYVSDWGPTWKPAELLAAKMLCIPIISHLRTPPQKAEAERSFLRFSRLIIGNSEFTLRPLRESGLPLRTIHNSINLEQFDKDKPKISPQRGEVKIAFAGKIRLKKGAMVFIEAAEKVLEQYKNAHFYIVGNDEGDMDGCLEKAQDRIARKGLSEHFTFTGLLYDAPQFMKFIDIIVVPSIFDEPFGRVNIEAMAAGKPVIASNVGGIPEVVKDGITGLLVPKEDVFALSGAMEKLIENEALRKKLGANGRKVVEDQFDSVKKIKEIEDAFRCAKTGKLISVLKTVFIEHEVPWRIKYFCSRYVLYPLMKNPNTKNYWDKRYKDTPFDSRRQEVYRDILEFLPGDTGFSLLDVGCARGEGCALIREKFPGADISGCDFSDEAIELARQRTKEINFFAFDIIKEDLRKTYDYITIISVLEHLDDPFFVIDKCLQKADECLIISCPYATGISYDPKDEHRFAFNEKSFDGYTHKWHIRPDRLNVAARRIIYVVEKTKE